ncbi:Usher syndrome type-1G protein homolog [Centruroides sculpturatus]|uniref:Usher syndrome type-1G protein homolog n=1 Tax=Centruroides sculpturatus TaxID=218467 RepID=UPI000C6D0A64|nr:Usher syndrome type-1G protein homolog [Centruroides sculpturatus]XP_023210382.1 Usher syndrome type-1G protein homolog [Centruroides sculpturatus]
MFSTDRDRFHRAARDGYLDLLREANRRDCNAPDEDGMTPTLWASYYGNLDALRLLVGRGGDPDKCDHYGNTALHCAAANGHINCVSFLVNFGVNLWSLDNDYHTCKDVAAMHQRDEILRYLDEVISKQSALNKKLVQKLKEKAIKDAEKRVKNYSKLQTKAARRAEKEEKHLEKQRKKMSLNENDQLPTKNILVGLKRDSKLHFSPTKYSEIVNTNSSVTRKGLGAVSKRVQHKKQSASTGGDFKVRENTDEEGKRSVRSLSGLRRDSEVMYVPKYDSPAGQRRHMKDVFTNEKIPRANSEPDFIHATDSGIGDDVALAEPASIFERPGFGSVAFRTTLLSLPNPNQGVDGDDSGRTSEKGSDIRTDDSIGSAGSLAQRNCQMPWEDDLRLDEEEDLDTSPIIIFLAAHGLTEYIPLFTKERIDLDSLMLLSEDDLKSLGLPLGPRRKLGKAMDQRKAILACPGNLGDSKL